MSFLYRFAITITRKQPYIDWANSQGDAPDLTPELARDRRTIYLAPESESEPDAAKLLEEFWEQIFEEELVAWVEDEQQWPAPRDRQLFDAWFDAEVTSSVFDLTPEEALTQSDVEALDLDFAIHRCAWCGIEVDDKTGQFVAFKLANRERLAHREGLTVPIFLDDDRLVVGVMSPGESDAARAGDDLAFRACTSHCEKALRSAVPKALRKAFRSG